MRHLTTILLSSLAILAAFVGSARADLSAPGPYAAGSTSVTVTRSNGSTFSAVLHYPATQAGANAPLDPSGAPYAAVSFGHGFLQPVARYRSTLEHLATHGYVVIASESEGGFFPSHSGLATDMRQCLTYLEQQNASASSFLFGAIDTSAFGMSGHSMGGGCSILAAAADPRVRALAPLAAADTNPSSKTAALSVQCATAYTDGSQDSIVPPGSNGQVMYANTPGPRRRSLIVGGFHCGFIDADAFGCDSGSMARSVQLSIVRRLLTEFFHTHLKHETDMATAAWPSVWGPAADSDTRVQVQIDPNATTAPASASITGEPGGTASFTLTITNTGTTANAFRLFAEGSSLPPTGEWSVTFFPTVTPLLASNGATQVTATVAIPMLGGATTEDFLVSARSESDDATRTWMSLTVTATCRADFDGSGFVDSDDFDAFVRAFEAGDQSADFDDSGFVDTDDFDAFVLAFELGC